MFNGHSFHVFTLRSSAKNVSSSTCLAMSLGDGKWATCFGLTSPFNTWDLFWSTMSSLFLDLSSSTSFTFSQNLPKYLAHLAKKMYLFIFTYLETYQFIAKNLNHSIFFFFMKII